MKSKSKSEARISDGFASWMQRRSRQHPKQFLRRYFMFTDNTLSYSHSPLDEPRWKCHITEISRVMKVASESRQYLHEVHIDLKKGSDTIVMTSKDTELIDAWVQFLNRSQTSYWNRRLKSSVGKLAWSKSSDNLVAISSSSTSLRSSDSDLSQSAASLDASTSLPNLKLPQAELLSTSGSKSVNSGLRDCKTLYVESPVAAKLVPRDLASAHDRRQRWHQQVSHSEPNLGLSRAASDMELYESAQPIQIPQRKVAGISGPRPAPRQPPTQHDQARELSDYDPKKDGTGENLDRIMGLMQDVINDLLSPLSEDSGASNNSRDESPVSADLRNHAVRSPLSTNSSEPSEHRTLSPSSTNSAPSSADTESVSLNRVQTKMSKMSLAGSGVSQVETLSRDLLVMLREAITETERRGNDEKRKRQIFNLTTQVIQQATRITRRVLGDTMARVSDPTRDESGRARAALAFGKAAREVGSMATTYYRSASSTPPSLLRRTLMDFSETVETLLGTCRLAKTYFSNE